MNVRALTFASLLFAAAHPALAESPAPTQSAQATIAEAAPATLGAKWNLSVKGGVLTAELVLVNTSGVGVDVLMKRGSSPATRVTGTLDGSELTAIYEPTPEREMMSRMGPMPVYEVVAANGEAKAGSFRFKLPSNYSGKSVHLEASVRTDSGETIVLPLTMVLSANGAV